MKVDFPIHERKRSLISFGDKASTAERRLGTGTKQETKHSCYSIFPEYSWPMCHIYRKVQTGVQRG